MLVLFFVNSINKTTYTAAATLPRRYAVGPSFVFTKNIECGGGRNYGDNSAFRVVSLFLSKLICLWAIVWSEYGCLYNCELSVAASYWKRNCGINATITVSGILGVSAFLSKTGWKCCTLHILFENFFINCNLMPDLLLQYCSLVGYGQQLYGCLELVTNTGFLVCSNIQTSNRTKLFSDV